MVISFKKWLEASAAGQQQMMIDPKNQPPAVQAAMKQVADAVEKAEKQGAKDLDKVQLTAAANQVKQGNVPSSVLPDLTKLTTPGEQQ
jgi:hypothetical protein